MNCPRMLDRPLSKPACHVAVTIGTISSCMFLKGLGRSKTGKEVLFAIKQSQRQAFGSGEPRGENMLLQAAGPF